MNMLLYQRLSVKYIYLQFPINLMRVTKVIHFLINPKTINILSFMGASTGKRITLDNPS